MGKASLLADSPIKNLLSIFKILLLKQIPIFFDLSIIQSENHDIEGSIIHLQNHGVGSSIRHEAFPF